MTLPPRILPDPDQLVTDLLRELLPGVTVGTQLSNPFGQTPYVYVHSTAFGTTVHWRFLRDAHVDVDYYTTGTRSSCADLGERVRVALFTAWSRQRTTSGGYIRYLELATAPYEQRLDGMAADEYRFTSTYRLMLRASA